MSMYLVVGPKYHEMAAELRTQHHVCIASRYSPDLRWKKFPKNVTRLMITDHINTDLRLYYSLIRKAVNVNVPIYLM